MRGVIAFLDIPESVSSSIAVTQMACSNTAFVIVRWAYNSLTLPLSGQPWSTHHMVHDLMVKPVHSARKAI